ncbi:MAG: radical SAM protein [Acidobacteria bacterium]|nr:radical SAM protein [Acidobacteriota bacterium]MCZ6492324.1 radical SAM protein [Acidobacteriota bacterium]MCZ6751077.1 radical SAM protein [Acidobacteriota bacterium]
MQLFTRSEPAKNAPPPLVGLGKIAAKSRTLGRKRKVEYFSLASKSILNRCDNPQQPFTWTINPYRGCEFGCKYCYARYTHEYMGMEQWQQFEEKIYSKERAGEILQAELGKDPGGAIAIGTATDPYQPAERHFQTTRRILETISGFRGLQVSITTKSDLIRRDVDLLRRIAVSNHLRINMTVTTLRADLARCLEVRAPCPALRLSAAAELARADLQVAVFAMPVLPAITDDPQDLEAVARAASLAGACYFAANVLFLMPSAQKAFFPFLEQKFPHLMKQYRRLYARGAYIRGDYSKQIQELVQQLREKYRLNGPPRHYAAEAFAPVSQMQLFARNQPVRQLTTSGNCG